MGRALNKWLKLKKEPGLKEEALLNVRVLSNFLDESTDLLCSEFGITGTQYNVLRILKGVYPEGHPRCEIIERMVKRASDITRLIDRLEKSGLVERLRTGSDRRMSVTKITKKGIRLIESIGPQLDRNIDSFVKKISADDCKKLSRICEKLYSDLA